MNKPKYITAHNFIALIAGLAFFTFFFYAVLLSATPIKQDTNGEEAYTPSNPCAADPQLCPGIAEIAPDASESPVMHVTGFSSVECHTTWCNAHRGEPRGSQVALNAKYHASQVYLPKYDHTYDVIGTTDENTDIDIWFGDDHATALEFGRQYLEVTLIP